MSDYTASQKKVIESTGKCLAVFAGAGSGKTSVLVERYISLVEKNTDPQNILAITFTKKAAGEMSERIRREIMKRAHNAEGDKREFWEKCKKALALAQIDTIHGFCNSLIRAHPVEAGVDPAFIIADDMDISLLADEAVKYIVNELLQKDDDDMAALCKEYGYNGVFRQMKKFVYEFDVSQVRQSDFAARLAKGHKAVLVKVPEEKLLFWSCMDALLENAANNANIERLKENLPYIREAIEELPEKHDKVAMLESYLSNKSLPARGANGPFVYALRDVKDRLIATCRDYKAVGLIASWAKVIKAVVERFSLLKRQKNLLSFDDLEYMAYGVLRKYGNIRVKYNQKYEHIMIDEFQDTNMLQKSIAYLLAGGNEERLSGDKLFVVGDDKQSIYRFRGAQVSVFGKVCEDIEKVGGEKITLLENFRSQKEILAVCNDIFSSLMQSAEIEYKPLLSGKEAENVHDPVEIILTEPVDDEDKIDAEAENIARKFCMLRKEGYKFSDMALLLRARTHLAAYTNAFARYNVPYNILDGQGFFDTPEIADMLNMLRFLDNNLKDLPLIGVLRSPFFAVDDATITAFMLSKSEGSLWNRLNSSMPEELDDDQIKAILHAKEILGDFLQKAPVLSLGVLVRYIVGKLRLMPLFMLYQDKKQKYANMEKFIDIVFAFEFETSGNLASFLVRIDNVLAEEVRESMEQIENEKSNSVKILTIHKSKGLQFPVVVIANCSARFMSNKEEVLYNDEYGLAIKTQVPGIGKGDTLLLMQQKAADNLQDRLEMQRLLYVAMTRAEKKLMLSAVKTETQTDNWLNWIKAAFTDEGDYLRGQTGQIKKAVIDEKISDMFLEETYDKNDCDVTGLIRQAEPLTDFAKGRELLLSATAVSDFCSCRRMFYYKYIKSMPEYAEEEFSGQGGGGLPANVIGLIAHSIIADMESLSFQQAFERACHRYAGASVKKTVRNELGTWLDEYLASSLYKEVEKGKYYSERGFCLPLMESGGNEVLFTGSIDRLQFVDDNRLRIIDFKSDKSIEGKKEKYDMQIFIYALAAKMLYPDKEILSGEVHFLRLKEKLDASLAENEATYMEKLQQICDDIMAGGEEADFASDTSWCRFCNYLYFCPEGET